MIKSKWLKAVLDSIIYMLAWSLASWIFVIVFSSAPSRYINAMIFAWGASLCVGYIRRIGWRVLLPLSVIHILYILIAFTLKLGLFKITHDAPELSWSTLGFFVPLTVVTYLYISSPVVVSIALRYVVKRVRKG